MDKVSKKRGNEETKEASRLSSMIETKKAAILTFQEHVHIK